MTLLLTQLGMAAIVFIGMVAVFYPEKIQTIEVKMSEVLTLGIPNPLLSFLQTERYLVVVRVFGAFTILVVTAAEFALSRRS